MEGEKKRGLGWWALAGVGVPTLLSLYVGAYYATVRPVRHVSTLSTEDWYWPVDMAPQYGPDSWAQFHAAAKPIFWPINEVDRKLRPEIWQAPPQPAPHLW